MQTIAVIGQKGGDGKTTLALGLAVSAMLAQQEVAIIDTDPQASADKWRKRRNSEHGPEVIRSPASNLPRALDVARNHGINMVIIDTPGRSDAAAVDAAKVANVVLIPVRPQIFGLETLGSVKQILKAAGNPQAYVVLNGLHPAATKTPGIQRELIWDTFRLSVLPYHLCQRQKHADAPTSGGSVQELDPAGKAAHEFNLIFQFLFKSQETTWTQESISI